MRFSRFSVLVATIAVLTVTGLGCEPASSAKNDSDRSAFELVFTFGSEKQHWLKEATDAFHKTNPTLPDGTPIRVRLIPMGSGECIDAVLGKYAPEGDKEIGADKPHLTSPASFAYFELGNDEAKAKGEKPIIDGAKKKNLVMSPVVIATWKPMAEALGWPKNPVGWEDILALSTDPKGWESKGKKQWGKFKFGHTHPEFSNSGLISVLAETYAGAKKKEGLKIEDVRSAEIKEFLTKIEQSVVFYGRSTGFFGDKMVEKGPSYMNAAVLYENMVIEANSGKNKPDQPMVAIYPKEGTFWSDHPVGVIDRPWVTDQHRQAAAIYLDFLMAEPQQKKAMTLGFRPGDEKIALDPEVFKADNGVDPKQPIGILEVPDAAVMKEIVNLWRSVKKPIRVTLVIDVSGSMNRDQKMVAAKTGAKDFVELLNARDEVSLIAFSDESTWVQKDGIKADKDGKDKTKKQIGELIASGETSLYDATMTAFKEMKNRHSEMSVGVVVVLTDGEDNKSKLKLEELLNATKYDAEGATIRIFTVAYGTDASKDVLKQIAENSLGKTFEGTPKNIQKVLRNIFTDL